MKLFLFFLQDLKIIPTFIFHLLLRTNLKDANKYIFHSNLRFNDNINQSKFQFYLRT